MTPELYEDLQKAKVMLKEGKTFVIVRQGKCLFESEKSGLAPYFDALAQGCDIFEDVVVADKVVGRASALLLLNIRLKGIFAEVMTYSAMTLLKSETCLPVWDELVECLLEPDSKEEAQLEVILDGITEYEAALSIIQGRSALAH